MAAKSGGVPPLDFKRVNGQGEGGAKDAAPLVTPRLQCPRGHPLHRFQIPTTDFICNVCSKRTDVVFGCRICDFDKCHDCAEADERAQKSFLAELPPERGSPDVVTVADQVQVDIHGFCVNRAAESWSACNPLTDDWTQRYQVVQELGSGQTAVVYEATATWPTGSALATPRTPRGGQKSPRGGKSRKGNKSPRGVTDTLSNASSVAASRKRRVALKRFPTTGTLMFAQELKALRAIGVHPHVLRLLESFKGPREDVLILEFCSGGDVYELYASNHGCCMLEAFVLHLLRQLLLALQHLLERGVEHRDVKPENLLLYSAVSDTTAVPHLKLADFGWAHVLNPGDKARPEVPSAGVGSLWYASPELNPPMSGPPPPTGLDVVPNGSSDMWSVGIIVYLLLIGHSPFNVALREADLDAREMQVIRLASKAKINTETRAWSCLSEEARDFICKLIQVDPLKRLSPKEAWDHPFVSQGARKAQGSGYLAKLPPLLPVADVVWKRIDTFQRLCWIAVARAVAEPELIEVRVFQMFIINQTMDGRSYLEQLAMEIAAVAQPAWFQRKTSWMDPLRLAFCYLDADNDGLLSMQDLQRHFVGKDARQVVEQAIQKWKQPEVSNTSSNGNALAPTSSAKGLTFGAFKWALSSSYTGQHQFLSQEVENGSAKVYADVTAGNALLEKRMQAIDEVCQRFLDEEFDHYGVGF